MAYSRARSNWVDWPSTATLIRASDLNTIDQAVYDLKTLTYNVKDYGAVGDGVTDDRVAVQAAINAAAAATYGGVVLFPPGDFLISSPGLTTPSNQQTPIVLRGSGQGNNAPLSQLKRNGAYTLLTASGTGATNPTINQDLRVHDLTFDGASQAATLIRLDRCAGVLFQNVRLKGSARKALHGSQIWNSRFVSCLFETSGDNGTTSPAVHIDGYTGAGATNTVHFSTCHWEGNAYDDLQLDAADTSSRCTGVIVTNSKWEGNTAGNHVHFKKAQDCAVVGGISNSNGGSTAPNILQDDGVLNTISGLTCIGTSNTYLVQLTGGAYFSITGCGFLGGSSAHVRLDSGFGQANVVGNSHQTLTTEANVSDARTTKTGTIDNLAGKPRARAYNSANQSINAGALTALALNSERYDTDSIHDTVTNNSRLTCQTAGTYAIRGNAEFANAADATRRILEIFLNGTTVIARESRAALNGQTTVMNVGCDYALSAGDYVELRALQDSAGAINVNATGNYSPEFSMVRID